jgi:ATP-binding cassette subfamily F protein uup
VRLSYKEQRELDALPADIETLEAEQTAITERLSQQHQPTANPQTIAADGKRLNELESIIQQKLERWSVLEAKVAK